MNRKNDGFTLAELLIVVAIVLVLVAIAIPVFTSQIEKSREATDLANIRSSFAEVKSQALTERKDVTGDPVALEQQEPGWQSVEQARTLEQLMTSVDGTPVPGGTAWIEFDFSTSECTLHYGDGDGGQTPDPLPEVPGSKAKEDAKDFPEGSNERLIMNSIEEAEREALRLYKEAGEDGNVAYMVTFGEGGKISLERVLDRQRYTVAGPATILKDGYMVGISAEGKVGCNLKYDKDAGKLTIEKSRIYRNKWHNEFYGFDFGY
ncbi:MAG: prepilin-type N-terminal cleavage/methylation domain-containing protein [Coriobacteriia bacterium]|nr:prepilin-type N-terminal cleavage/methylation domain-containing protein [Coriobacteriia bacterium]